MPLSSTRNILRCCMEATPEVRICNREFSQRSKRRPRRLWYTKTSKAVGSSSGFLHVLKTWGSTNIIQHREG